jgi:hypothetical protein
MRLSLEDCDVEKDITAFIKDCGTGQEIPDPPKFINFCRGDAETSSQVSEDENYSVAQFARTMNPTYRTSSPQPSMFESHHDPNNPLAKELGLQHDTQPIAPEAIDVLPQQPIPQDQMAVQPRHAPSRQQSREPPVQQGAAATTDAGATTAGQGATSTTCERTYAAYKGAAAAYKGAAAAYKGAAAAYKGAATASAGATAASNEGAVATADEGATAAVDEGATATVDEGATTAVDEGATAAVDEGATAAVDEGATTDATSTAARSASSAGSATGPSELPAEPGSAQ